MTIFNVTYELADPNSGKFIAQIPDVPIIVLESGDILPELKRRYPMFKIDLTTCNIIMSNIKTD